MAGQDISATIGLTFNANIKINPSRSELAQAGSSLRLPFTDADKSQSFTCGVDINQINTIWHDRVQAAYATGDSIDLENLTDEFGQGFAFTRINGIFVQNRGTVGIHVTGDAGASRNTPWANNAILVPGGGHGWFCFVAPDATAWAVTTAKKDVEFNMISAGDAQNVDVGIMGLATFS